MMQGCSNMTQEQVLTTDRLTCTAPLDQCALAQTLLKVTTHPFTVRREASKLCQAIFWRIWIHRRSVWECEAASQQHHQKAAQAPHIMLQEVYMLGISVPALLHGLLSCHHLRTGKARSGLWKLLAIPCKGASVVNTRSDETQRLTKQLQWTGRPKLRQDVLKSQMECYYYS